MRDVPERRVIVAMPSYDGRMDVNTCFTISQFQQECDDRGWGFGLMFASYIAPIEVARSSLATDFLRVEVNGHGATDMFFLDADVACDAKEMVKLVEHPVDFVFGVYAERHLNKTYTALALDSGLKRDPDTGLVEMQGGTAGFMRLRRVVLETMMQHLDPNDCYRVATQDVKIPMLFKSTHTYKRTSSEDIGFGRRWRELGGRVWMDPDLNLEHTGRASFCSNFLKDYLLPNKLLSV